MIRGAMLPPVRLLSSVPVSRLFSERIQSVLISRLDTTGGWFVPELAGSGHRDLFSHRLASAAARPGTWPA